MEDRLQIVVTNFWILNRPTQLIVGGSVIVRVNAEP
jgi:hypothetical protein